MKIWLGVVFNVDVEGDTLSQLHDDVAFVWFLKQSADFRYLVAISNEVHQIELFGAAHIVASVALIAFKYFNSHFSVSFLNVVYVLVVALVDGAIGSLSKLNCLPNVWPLTCFL